MLKKACCYLCLTVNKRNINIYKTDLQNVYEKLADIKITDECWMCYICHRRLQQCHRLQQLAVQTRGLINDLGKNKVNKDIGAIVSLLELSISKTKFVSTHLNYIKQETDLKAGPSDYNEIHRDEDICEYAGNREENVKSIEFEVRPVKQEYIEDSGEQTTALCKQSIEFKIEIEDTGIEQDDELEYASGCEGRGRAADAPPGRREGRGRAADAPPGRRKAPHICDVCSKTFKFKCQLLRHAMSHTGDKPYACETCAKRFSDKNNLKKHKQIHTGDKPFACDVCPKKFIQKSALTKHRRTHTGEKPFACDVCSRRFSMKQSLENHVRIHTGDKPYGCDVCLMKFIERSTLLNHTKTHTGDKPFMCDVCSKKFSLRASLNNHIRTHTGDKPFGCVVCSKRFSKSSHLSRHKKIHSRDKP